MKLVTAIVQPGRLDDLREALSELGILGMTITEARGCGRQKGRTEIYRGAEYEVDLVDKLRVEILAEDTRAPDIVECVVTTSRTGRVGDGKVWVTPVDEVVRVRTGEQGAMAL